jgi:hypothetical protein
MKDPEFQDILHSLTENWNDLTFEDVQYMFREWQIRLNWVMENGGEYYSESSKKNGNLLGRHWQSFLHTLYLLENKLSICETKPDSFYTASRAIWRADSVLNHVKSQVWILWRRMAQPHQSVVRTSSRCGSEALLSTSLVLQADEPLGMMFAPRLQNPWATSSRSTPVRPTKN